MTSDFYYSIHSNISDILEILSFWELFLTYAQRKLYPRLRYEEQESNSVFSLFFLILLSEFVCALGFSGSIHHKKCDITKRSLQRRHSWRVLFRTRNRRRAESLGDLSNRWRVLQQQ